MTQFVFPIKSGVDIRRARLLLGMSQAKLADLIGLQPATICRAEKSEEVKESLSLSIECLLRRKQAGELPSEDKSDAA